MAETEDRSAAADVEWLYGTYAAVVRSHLSVMGVPPDTLEDLVQDTFVRLLTTRDAAGVEHPPAYLRAVARSVLADWRTEVRRQHAVASRLGSLAEVPADLAPLSDETNLLASLPPVDQRVVRLRALLDWPFADIGHTFHHTATWARVRYHRALGRLRKASTERGPHR